MAIDLDKVLETTIKLRGKCIDIDRLVDYARSDTVMDIGGVTKTITAADKTKLLAEYEKIKAEMPDIYAEFP